MPKSKNTDFFSCFKKLIKHSDQFNIRFDFHIKKKFTYQTFVGGLIFILYILLISAYFISSFITFLSKTEFNIRYHAENIMSEINITKNNFFYSIFITSDNKTNMQNFDLQDFFIITQTKVERIGPKKNSKKTPSFPCQENNSTFTELLKSSYYMIDNSLEHFFCFDIPEIEIQGNYNTNKFHYIVLNVELNITTYNREKDIFLKFLEKDVLKINLIFSDRNLDFQTGEIHDDLSSVYTEFSMKIYDSFDLFFNQIYFNRDNNLFIKKYDKIESSLLSNFDKNILYRKSEINDLEKYMARFYFRADKKREIIDIYYEKIPQLLSNLSGLKNTIFIGLNVFLSVWNNFKAKQSIFSRIYKFKDLFYTNFKEYKEIYQFEKSGAFNKVSNMRKGKFIEQNKDYKEDLQKESTNKEQSCPVDVQNRKNFQNSSHFKYSSIELNNISSDRKLKLENSLSGLTSKEVYNKLNSTRNSGNKIKNETDNFSKIGNELWDSNCIKKANNLIELNNKNPNQLINLDKCPENISRIENEDEGKSTKNNRVFRPQKLTNESKQYLQQYINNIKYKRSKPNYKLDEKILNPLKIRFYDLYLNYICCKKEHFKRKIEPFKLAENNFYYYLDIITYMKKMNELDTFKGILLGQDSKIIMEFISMPILESNDGKESQNIFKNKVFEYLFSRKFKSENTKINKETFEDLFISYKNLKKCLNERDNNRELSIDHSQKIENVFEKQMEYLYDDC